MLDRRRLLAAALTVMAYPVGVVLAQPVPFRPPMPPPRREVRPRHPRGHGPWYWSRGGGMAAAGFGCPGVGGAEWSGAFTHFQMPALFQGRDKMQSLHQRTPDQVSAAAVLMALGGASGEQ